MKRLILLLIAFPCFSQGLLVNPINRTFPAGGGGGGATATDSFDRTDVTPISNPMSDGAGTWTSGPGEARDIGIVSNNADGPFSGQGMGRVSSPTFAADQKATITYNGVTACGPAVRIASATDADCYDVYVLNSTTLRIRKITDDGSGEGSLSAATQGSNITVTALVAGDTISISATGTGTVTLEAFVNDVSVATRTDATSPYDTGQPGIFLDGNDVTIQAFTATDL